MIKNLRKAKTESDRRGDTCAKRDQETQRDKGTETDRGRETGGSPTHAPAEEEFGSIFFQGVLGFHCQTRTNQAPYW